MPTSAPLTWQMRADLFAQLAALEQAGLPAAQAVDLLRLPTIVRERIAMTGKFLARGMEISTAGKRGGLFTELEASLIGAATAAGSPVRIYRRLAGHYAQRATQARTIKSRMALPALLLTLGLFVQPLPALLSGKLSGGAYLLHSLGLLAAIAALPISITFLLKQREGAAASILPALPWFGKMLVRRNLRDFFESLALLLEAGMPILQALPKALDTVQSGTVKNALAGIRTKIERGSTLTQALEDIALLEGGSALALIETGEESGTLPEMLFRYAAMESSVIENFDKQIAEWLPRIVYAAVAGWIAYGILNGAGVGTDLPPDLR